MQIPAFTIPLIGDPTNPNSVNNAFTGRSVVIPQNATVSFPVTFFLGSGGNSSYINAATMVSDFSNIVSAEFVLRAASGTTDPAAGALMFDQPIPVANLNTALTFAQYQTGLLGHAMFTMSSADTNRPPGNYYLAFGVTTTNAGNVPMGFATNVTIVDRGIFAGGTPSTPTAISYTEQQSDARYPLLTGPDSVHINAALTGLTGGGASNLDGLATTGFPTGYTLLIFTPAATVARLELDSTASAGGQVVTPPDHDASANPRSWRIRL